MKTRSHYTKTLNGETFHVFNPNTEGVTDEGHILSPIHCPLCNEEPLKECRACGISMDAHDKIDSYGYCEATGAHYLRG